MRLPPLDEIALRWREAQPILARATARSASYEPIDLLRIVLAGQAACWFVEREGDLIAVAIGMVHTHPRNRVLEVPFIGGAGIWRWAKPLLAALDDYARALKCVSIMGFDRAGWARFGFKITGAVMERRIS